MVSFDFSGLAQWAALWLAVNWVMGTFKSLKTFVFAGFVHLAVLYVCACILIVGEYGILPAAIFTAAYFLFLLLAVGALSFAAQRLRHR